MSKIISSKDVIIPELDKSLYDIILDQSSDPIFCFDKIGTYLYINMAFSKGFGLMPSDIIGKRIWDVFPGEAGDMRFAAVKKAYETKQEGSVEVKVDAVDGVRYYLTTVTPIMDEHNEPVVAICISKEITRRKTAELALAQEKKISEQQNEALDHAVKELYIKSITDSMTDLYNRRYCIDQLQTAINSAKKRQAPISLGFIDLDYYKAINDQHGHLIGDEVLIEFSKALKDYFSDIGTVGRYGGEEFIVILPELALTHARAKFEAFRQEVAKKPFTSKQIPLTISIGLSEYEDEDINSFIKKSDDLLYLAKDNGRNRIEI